jgi:hypothetical protein
MTVVEPKISTSEWMGSWRKQKTKIKERLNVKLLALTIEYKELKKRMVEYIALQKEFQKLKKKSRRNGKRWNNSIKRQS